MGRMTHSSSNRFGKQSWAVELKVKVFVTSEQRQSEILSYITCYFLVNGRGATRSEIADYIGIAVINVLKHLNRLIALHKLTVQTAPMGHEWRYVPHENVMQQYE